MGIYVNPGNRAFQRISGSGYVDKTNLIALLNDRIDCGNSLVCVSRPRRFGKSYAAKMLAAYYDCSCDSHELFDLHTIAKSDSYRAHLNRYHVIYLEITGFISAARRQGLPLCEVPNQIVEILHRELLALQKQLLPQTEETVAGSLPYDHDASSLTDLILHIVALDNGRPFVFVIDEWDAMIREAKDDPLAQTRYLDLLREWFKTGTFTPKAVAAAYMTGILPIKKDGSQSAISDFQEFSILNPGIFSKYTGFTQQEVRDLCSAARMDFQEIKTWYDGYAFPEAGSIYNPYSVISAIQNRKCRSYWKQTSAAEALKTYISMDFDGLQASIIRLIAGEPIPVDPDGFQNDFETFETADDVLTLLIHLGYLAYNEQEGTVRIPNEEVRLEFRQFLKKKPSHGKWMQLIQRSQKLLEDTIAGKPEAVAASLEQIRREQYAPQYYNNEQALRAVVKYAYIASFGQYLKIEELPSGKGIADLAFIPLPLSPLPPMIIELKWNRTSGGAISQIREKHYTTVLQPFEGNILLVGINYDEKTGKHTCSIEEG